MLPLIRCVSLMLLFAWATVCPARAGVGPERTLLVVNADSGNSLRVANEYIRLRRIPASHVFHLRGVPRMDVLSVDAFRDRIWKPIRDYMKKEDLDHVIDVIVYSADFPYAVDFTPDVKAAGKPGEKPKLCTGSLTGFTYFAHWVETKEPFYRWLFLNRYYRWNPGDDRYHSGMRQAEMARLARSVQAVRAGEYKDAVKSFEADFERFYGDWKTWLACARALGSTGKEAEAFQALREAVRRGLPDLERLDRTPVLKKLKAHPDFQALMAEAKVADRGVPPALGFQAGPAGSAGRYYLCTCLGYTGVRGNSVPEILRMIRSAAGVDGTRPEGTVYLMRNKDVRSRTRAPAFQNVVRSLKALGRKVAILEKGKDGQDGKIPKGKDDVLGAVVGIASFNWPASGSRMLPGAVCEHLTSFGAYFRTAGQTKVSEFLRHGAAGTSGTVVEPYALQMKFPHPALHVYYAEGSSLVEAFYQSVWGPYQLLILGDALACPFGRFASVSLASPPATAPWKGVVEVRAAVKPAPGCPPARVELWVDGRLVAGALPGKALSWDTRTVDDGHHEVRLVAVDATRLATRSSSVHWVRVGNGSRTLRAAVRPGTVALGNVVKIRGRAPGCERVDLVRGCHVLASHGVQGGAWRLEVPTDRLGVGRVVVQVRAVGGEGPGLRSAPLEVTVAAPKPWPGKTAPGPFLEGFQARIVEAGGRKRDALLATLDDTRGRSVERDLRKIGIKKADRLGIEGEFRVKTTGLHQFTLRAAGALTLEVDGRVLCKARPMRIDRPVFLAVPLAAGWHALKVDLKTEGAPRLVAFLGGVDVCVALEGGGIRHPLSGMAGVRKAPEAVVDKGKAAAVLVDGKRGGKAVQVPGSGVNLSWKRSERKVQAVVLYPPRATKKSPAWPRTWSVDYRSGSGPWRKVIKPQVQILRAAARGRGKHEIPQFLMVSFRPVTARALRIRPTCKKGEAAHLTEIEVYRKK